MLLAALTMKLFLAVCCALFLEFALSLTVSSEGSSRRDFLEKASRISLVTAGGLLSTPPSIGRAADDGSNSLPYCVIGANGRTGTKCVQACLERNLPVRATSRSGVYNGGDEASASTLLTPMLCDVTDPKTIDNAVQGTRAVIFAASASKKGGTPSQVDNQGLVNVASACLANKVPHLIIVSSGSVTKPNSPVYKFLNLFGGIMDEKIKGEDGVREIYRGSPKGSTYTVIRPGGLIEDPPRGVAALELNQGDTKSGRISRSDVASLCVEAARFPKYTAAATFECYDADTGKPLETVGVSNILKQKVAVDDFVTGRECRGDSWEELFSGLESDDS